MGDGNIRGLTCTEVVGYAANSDAHHVAAPHPEGRGAQACFKRALEDAKIDPARIGYINAHGTSTELNDKGETAAIKAVFGDHAHKLAVSSTKSMTGHTLGAAGGIEAGITALAIARGVLPPTINYETPDPECDLDYVPNEARPAPDATVGVLSNPQHGVSAEGMTQQETAEKAVWALYQAIIDQDLEQLKNICPLCRNWGDEFLRAIIFKPGREDRVVGIGETGLDFYRKMLPGKQPPVEIWSDIGPFVLSATKIWFASTFYDGEGVSGVGAVGTFDVPARKYQMRYLPEQDQYSFPGWYFHWKGW